MVDLAATGVSIRAVRLGTRPGRPGLFLVTRTRVYYCLSKRVPETNQVTSLNWKNIPRHQSKFRVVWASVSGTNISPTPWTPMPKPPEVLEDPPTPPSYPSKRHDFIISKIQICGLHKICFQHVHKLCFVVCLHLCKHNSERKMGRQNSNRSTRPGNHPFLIGRKRRVSDPSLPPLWTVPRQAMRSNSRLPASRLLSRRCGHCNTPEKNLCDRIFSTRPHIHAQTHVLTHTHKHAHSSTRHPSVCVYSLRNSVKILTECIYRY